MNGILFWIILNIFVPIIYCDDDSESTDSWNVTFNLFTRQERQQQVILTMGSEDSLIEDSGFNAELRTKFIVHGWQGGYYKTNVFDRLWMKDMKDYILDAIDCNVICVDWAEQAESIDYLSVLPNVPIVGGMISKFIDKLKKILKASPNDIHCIGHSLGAHVCAFAGKGQASDKLAEITGLDPAGPGYDEDSSTRLSPSDANLVVVSHTSSGFDVSGDVNIDGFIGNPDPLGHFDFRINGGNQQPLCMEFRNTMDALKDLVELKFKNALSDAEKVGFCPHESAYIYPIAKPDNGCEFIAYLCDEYSDFEAGKCAKDYKPIEFNFGFYDKSQKSLNKTKGPKNMFIKTGDKYPYCLFHYQIILELKSTLSSEQTVEITLFGQKNVDLQIKLTPDNGQTSFTYLYTDKEELGPLSKATVAGDSLDVDVLSVNFMSHLDQKVRQNKSYKIKVTSTETKKKKIKSILEEII